AAERYWQVPLVDEYVQEMESWYGDIINSGSAEGSLVKSGIFLREFRTVPWVHIDIGGSGYYRKTLPYAPRGASGVTHATLVELAIPIIPIAIVLDVTGRNPLVGDAVLSALLVAAVIPIGLYLLSIPFGAGAFGMGDVKLLIGVGLLLGLARTIGGLLAGLLA